MRELKRIRVDEVSLVKNPANRRKFLLLKEADVDPLAHHLAEVVALLKGGSGNEKAEDLREAAEYLLEYVQEIRENRLEKQTWRVGGDRDLPLIEDSSWDADAAVASVRRWAEKENGEIDFRKYRRAFIIYDADAPENLTSYKFPFARVVDGELRASRAGLITAKRMALGARSGQRHPLADRIVAFVNSYLGEEDEEKEIRAMEERQELEVTKEIQELQKEIEELRKRAEEAEKRAAEERERRIQKEYEEKAEKYASLGIEKSVLVQIMRKLDEAGIDYVPHFEAIRKKVEEAGLYKEFGVSDASEVDFESLVEKSDEKDVTSLIREAARKNPQAFEQYRKRLTGR